MSQASSANPVIVLVSGADTDRLEAVMSRYAEEYDLLTATSSGAAAEVAAGVVGEGREVALLVTDGALPDEEIRAACERWRSTVPTARRVVLAPIERFVDEAKEMRAELAKGTFDSYLILPQGIRDEEFHNALTDLLSDWGSTVANGASPHTAWLPPEIAVDDHGFVLTGRDVPQDTWADGVPPANLATTVPGVFAIGDVRSGSMKRVAAASGEGSSVVPLVHAYLAGRSRLP